MTKSQNSSKDDYLIRPATPADALEISLLYHKVYAGKYSDPMMRDVNLLTGFLSSHHSVWIIAIFAGEVVGSVIYEVDPENRLAKTFGGAVLSDHRGSGILERMMAFGQQELSTDDKTGVEVTYATTRTATKAPQVVTEKLGYRKLGIFPNVHRTENYETHGLVALYSKGALERRFVDFPLHPEISQLFDLVRKECGLPEQRVASREEISAAMPQVKLDEVSLEVLDAPRYTIHRFRELRDSGQLRFHFYPFHEPNVLISSPADDIQVFLYLAPVDKYCTIVGIRQPRDLNAERLLSAVSRILRDRGVRYIETIVRSDKLATVEHIVNAGFIPSAYFPAFQVQENKRYDYIVLSKTFEVFDFSGIQLAGLNKKYLLQYFDRWKKRILNPLGPEEI